MAACLCDIRYLCIPTRVSTRSAVKGSCLRMRYISRSAGGRSLHAYQTLRVPRATTRGELRMQEEMESCRRRNGQLQLPTTSFYCLPSTRTVAGSLRQDGTGLA